MSEIFLHAWARTLVLLHALCAMALLATTPCEGRRTLFLLAGPQGRLPARTLLAWRRGNDLDLLFLGFLGFPIASLLTLRHVDLPGFVGDVGTGYPQSPMP